MKITFLAENLERNSIGRTYCTWLLATSLGWEAQVLSTRGDEVWWPLRRTAFAAACRVVAESGLADEVGRDTDLIIASKPLASSFGLARGVAARLGIPLLLDVDDPDLENRLSVGRPLRRAAKAVLRPRETARALRLRALARRTPTIVSNPWLQRRYGGTIIPHVRADRGSGAEHVTTSPHVVFVGTNRPHKGIDELRRAVADLHEDGFTLTVTDERPPDALPWETWTGMLPFEEGMDLVAKADVVVIPSRASVNATGQLPAKLMDAMLAGRAVVVSDIEPMPWAIGEAGRTFAPGDADGLAEVLRELRAPETRARLGAAARGRALERFTVERCGGAFEDACTAALGRAAPRGTA